MGEVVTYLPYLLAGVGITVAVSALAFGLAVVLGLAVCAGRLSAHRPLSWITGLYVDVFRSTPVFIQLIWFYYVLPILIPGVSLDGFATATIGLGASYAALFAEVFRTGIFAVPVGQRESALSLGMTPAQVMRRVVLPQAIRNVLPPSTSGAVSLVKDSSIASTLAVNELVFQAGTLNALIQRPVEILAVVAAFYFALTFPLTLLGNALHRRWVSPTTATRSLSFADRLNPTGIRRA